MNRSQFESFLETYLGGFEKTAQRQGTLYTVVEPRSDRFAGRKALISDGGMDGISVRFYNPIRQKLQTIDHIYHWSDAYELLRIGLLTPGSLKYKEDDPDAVSIARTLDREPHTISWEMPGFSDVNDMDLLGALRLVKYGYIDELCLATEDGQTTVSPHGRLTPCREDCAWDTLLDGMRRVFHSGQSDPEDTGMGLEKWRIQYGSYTVCKAPERCKRDVCVLWLCAYLEYAARNDILYEILQKRANERMAYRTPCGPYQFTWMQDSWLKTLDKSRFNLACRLVDSGAITVDRELDGENRVKTYNPMCCFDASEPVTSRYLAERAKANGSDSYCRLPVYSASPSMSGCPNCSMHAHCVIFYAGYIKYLRDCGREEEILADRAWFRQHQREAEEETREEFGFSIPADLFLNEPDEMFETAELLQEHNYVSIRRAKELNDDGMEMYCIETTASVVQYDDLAALRRDVPAGQLDYVMHTYHLYNFVYFEPLKKHIVLAGYIDYLRKTGQYETYKEQVAQLRRRTAEALAEQQRVVPALEKVMAIAGNEKESSLYCVIEGERGIGKREVVQQIAQLLKQSGKIDDDNYISCTFENLATQLGFLCLRDTGANMAENAFYEYDVLETRKLYVLTDLKEFLHLARQANDADGSKTSHLIKLLGRYQPQTYIIVIGERRYVEQFTELSPQIKFLFGNNVISMDNLSPEQLYKIFLDKLSSSLRKELEQTADFKNKFLDYIIMNRRLLPLGNQELADYLADYANNRKELALPPNVYRKQSAKEMLASVIGMENVKNTAYEFEKYALFLKRAESDGMTLPNSNLHMLFTGNPGTGKTMVARVMGQMLFDLGIVRENKVVEVESKDLKAAYLGQSAGKTADVIARAMDGVLFIDEAYAIGNDSFGKEVIATLIKAMEDHRDRFVVILAGYEKEMQEFLNINSGIASRIGYTFHFDDYSVDELTEMFDMKMKKAGFTYIPSVLTLVRDVCAHFIGKKNFGNGRFVDKLIQRVILKHAVRDMDVDMLNVLTASDIPTVEEMVSTDVVHSGDYEAQLAQFIGMGSIKEKVRKFAKFVQFRQQAKDAGANIPAGNMHMIFTGNPGTGKTTIARIMADILYDLGVIKENKLVEVERKDLVGTYVGQTAPKTAEAIDGALDGILFIDEAYTLTSTSPNDFGSEAIATLIKAMEDHKNDLIVIFAGYKDEMRQFINANPGIASRIGYTFNFDDYTPDELLEMYRKKLEDAGFSVSEAALKKARNVTEYFSKRKNFGNGRFVGKLQQETLVLHSDHLLPDGSNLLIIGEDDIPDITDINNTPKRISRSSAMEQIIGMAAVKEKLREFESIVNFTIAAKERGLTVPDANMHMLFTGNPGTGKTTVARIIAQKLYDIGVIMENKLVEVERKDLVAGYVGQTAIKTGEAIEKALGGILFVDEAYTLTPTSASDFGGEAIATLIKAMEDHKNDLIVIFAGYEDEMQSFVQSNPGVASRLGFTFHFDDYSAAELREIFVNKLTASGFSVTEEARDKTERLMQYFCRVKNFGNGRFVDKVIQSTLSRHARDYRPETMDVINEDDIPEIRDITGTMNGAQSMVTADDVTEQELRRVAIHESGHALVQSVLFPDVPIKKITIRVEGTGALGYVEHSSHFGVQNTRTVYQNSIAVLMAGLAAEQAVLGASADGGSSDIRAAVSRARVMITQCGMSKHGFAGADSEAAVMEEINELLGEGFDAAKDIIAAGRTQLDQMVDLLMAGNDLTDTSVKAIMAAFGRN